MGKRSFSVYSMNDFVANEAFKAPNNNLIICKLNYWFLKLFVFKDANL
jgi:hypothetical protein